MKKLSMILLGLSSLIAQAMNYSKDVISNNAQIRHAWSSNQNQSAPSISMRIRGSVTHSSNLTSTLPQQSLELPLAAIPTEKELHDRLKNKVINFIKNGDFEGLACYQREIEVALSGQPRSVRAVIKEHGEAVRRILDDKDVKTLIAISKSSIKDAVLLHSKLDGKATDQMILDASRHILSNKEGFREFLDRDPFERAAEYAKDKNEATSSSVASTADLVSTPAHPVTNISKEVDAQIQATLNELQGEYSDLQKYLQAVGSVLQDMKDQGFLTPTSEVFLTPEVIEAIAHGAKHFVKQFKPSENPKEFIEAVIKYGVCATFHTMTNGVFLGADKLVLIGSQVHAILQTDFSSMNAQQKAEFIAEKVADILKMALADQVGRKIVPKTRFGGISSQTSSTSSTKEVHEAVTPDGVRQHLSGDIKSMSNVNSVKISLDIQIKDILKDKYHVLETMEKLKPNVSKNTPSELSVGLDTKTYLSLFKKAEEMYEKIRLNNTDVKVIAKNTGLSEKYIDMIKNHIFIKEHDLGNLGVRRFDADPNIVAAWERLVNNTFCSVDVTFLQHEYAESLIMEILEIKQSIAHAITNNQFNWDTLLKRQ